MPLVKSETGEPINAECVNGCGALSRYGAELKLVADKGDEAPITALVCPKCHYLELYFGRA